MQKLRAWARQPTTVVGISALIGSIMAVVLKQVSFAEVVPLLTAAAFSILLPDNAAASQQAEDIAKTILVLMTDKQGVKS